MQTKLTLRLEKSLIDQAKAWADEKQLSLSHVVAMLFQRLTAMEPKKEELHPFMKKIIGVAKKKGSASITDKDANEAYYNYLEEKYK
jgi:hypothetical protein